MKQYEAVWSSMKRMKKIWKICFIFSSYTSYSLHISFIKKNMKAIWRTKRCMKKIWRLSSYFLHILFILLHTFFAFFFWKFYERVWRKYEEIWRVWRIAQKLSRAVLDPYTLSDHYNFIHKCSSMVMLQTVNMEWTRSNGYPANSLFLAKCRVPIPPRSASRARRREPNCP